MLVGWQFFFVTDDYSTPGTQSKITAKPQAGKKAEAAAGFPASQGLVPSTSEDSKRQIVEKLDSAFAEKKSQQAHSEKQLTEPPVEAEGQSKEDKKQELMQEIFEKRNPKSAADTLPDKQPQKNQKPDTIINRLD